MQMIRRSSAKETARAPQDDLRSSKRGRAQEELARARAKKGRGADDAFWFNSFRDSLKEIEDSLHWGAILIIRCPCSIHATTHAALGTVAQ